MGYRDWQNNMVINELTQSIILETDKAFESSLRPKFLKEFVGQNKVKKQVELIIKSAKSRSSNKKFEYPDHMLFSGPPGLGKTTLAMIVANEMGVDLKLVSGPNISHAGDMAAILTKINEGTVLFIDEIHRLGRSVQELLYIAMEDFRIDIITGKKGIESNSYEVPLPKFTLIGATTRSGMLPGPLRDRFGYIAQMDYYTDHELQKIVIRSANEMNVNINDDAAYSIAQRSRGTARIANRLLNRVRDYSHVYSDGSIQLNDVEKTMNIYEVDSNGLDKLDLKVLKTLVSNFNGGPVGLKALSASVNEEEETLESVVEPFLFRKGLIYRTAQGRIATDLGKEYII